MTFALSHSRPSHGYFVDITNVLRPITASDVTSKVCLRLIISSYIFITLLPNLAI